MKGVGFIYIVLGIILTVAGFALMASDIQLIIAFCGINMAGIGLIMRKLSTDVIHKG